MEANSQSVPIAKIKENHYTTSKKIVTLYKNYLTPFQILQKQHYLQTNNKRTSLYRPGVAKHHRHHIHQLNLSHFK